MITKIIYQDSNEEFVKAIERNGEAMCTLIDTERGVKSASSALVSRKLLEEYRPKDSHTACIHLIAMGNSDQYGFNRNGDYFSGDVLEKRTPTFVTNGRMYREHRNRDPKKAIGKVMWAGYDPKGMQRVELIVHMDKDKAEKEYQMAKEGKALNFSMSCRVPNDRCSCCGNEAKSVDRYCEHLGHRMGQYVDDFKKYAFAYNDNPTFFDISVVKNPADRNARHLDYIFQNKEDDLYKAANVMCKAAATSGSLVPSAVAAMAEGLNLGCLELNEQATITKLAASEQFAEESIRNNAAYTSTRANALLNSYPCAMRSELTQEELNACSNVQPGTLFRELTKRACILSFPAFCQYVSGEKDICNTEVVKTAALLLPSVFRDMERQLMTLVPCTDEFEASSDFMASRDPGRSDLVQKLMDGMEDKFSVEKTPRAQRIISIIIRDGTSPVRDTEEELKKEAATSPWLEKAAKLASLYGQYQVKALCDITQMQSNDLAIDDLTDYIVGANLKPLHG